MGREMYLLHDNGRKLFTSPHDCTPKQRFVYLMAKDYHTDDPQSGVNEPHGLSEAKRFDDSTTKLRGR